MEHMCEERSLPPFIGGLRRAPIIMVKPHSRIADVFIMFLTTLHNRMPMPSGNSSSCERGPVLFTCVVLVSLYMTLLTGSIFCQDIIGGLIWDGPTVKPHWQNCLRNCKGNANWRSVNGVELHFTLVWVKEGDVSSHPCKTRPYPLRWAAAKPLYISRVASRHDIRARCTGSVALRVKSTRGLR